MAELHFEDQVMQIGSTGAVINRYSVSGVDVLFPRQVIDGSVRGGSHVCLPNFGPDEKTGQPQHGYGRVVDWGVVEIDSQSITFEYLCSEGSYEGLYSRLRYSLGLGGLIMSLHIENRGGQLLEVAPGFHPYFTLPGGVRGVLVGESVFDVDSVSGTEWIDVEREATVAIGDRRIVIEAAGMSRWAIWTAHPNRYICIEPTYGGNSHLNGEKGLFLGPSDTRDFMVRIDAQATS